MNELPVRRGVPPEPEAEVAVEAPTFEERKLLNVVMGCLAALLLVLVGNGRWVGGGDGPGYHISQDFPVVGGESRSQSENSSRKKLEDGNGILI